MDIRIIKKIENVEDFKCLIEEVIENSKLSLRKKQFDIIALNSDKKQMITYNENERQRIISKLKKNSFTFRVAFENENIVVNQEDYEQLFIYPKYIYEYLEQIKWNEEHYLKEKNELLLYYKKRLKDLKKSIYIAFHNNQIELLRSSSIKEDLKKFYPFYKEEVYSKFITYLQLNIVKPYLDISYLYQRLIKDNLIYYIKQIDFIEWLFTRELINKNIYEDFIEKGQFYSLDKSETDERQNKFDTHFNLN